MNFQGSRAHSSPVTVSVTELPSIDPHFHPRSVTVLEFLPILPGRFRADSFMETPEGRVWSSITVLNPRGEEQRTFDIPGGLVARMADLTAVCAAPLENLVNGIFVDTVTPASIAPLGLGGNRFLLGLETRVQLGACGPTVDGLRYNGSQEAATFDEWRQLSILYIPYLVGIPIRVVSEIARYYHAPFGGRLREGPHLWIRPLRERIRSLDGVWFNAVEVMDLREQRKILVLWH